nr:hypothetical protein HK105_001834 [Polyrhizophydium stewartii]
MSHSELSRELSRNSAAVVLAILSSINSAGDLDELDPAIDPDIRLALAQMQPWVPPPSTHLHGTSIASMAFAQHPLPPKSAAFAAAPPTLGHAMSALEALRSAIGSNAVSDMLRPQRLYKMVHNLHLGLDMDKLPVHRRRLMLNSYRVFLVIAGAHAFHPLIFRTVIQHLLKYAEHEATLGTSCAIMAFLVERAFHTGFKKNLSENLVQLCSSLAKIAVDYQRRAAALSAQAQSPLPGSSSDQQPGFQMPNRPLQSMALADAAVLNWAAESIVALFETVLRLVEGCDGMPIQLALLGVDSENVLFQRLMAKYSPSQIAPEVLKKALLDHPVRSPAPIRHLQRQLDGHGLPGWLAAESLPLLTARLRVLVRSEADPSISSSLRTEAAKCLGKLDALAPNVHSVGDDLLLAPDQRPPTSASPPQCHEGCLVAMRHLIAALFEPNLEIASIASRTLMTVAATADGRAAIQNLSAREASYIDIFQGRGSSARSLAPYQMYTPIAHGALFVDGRTETQWVVEVANSLLASFDYDTFFASLGLMMDMRPELADAILPFLFHLPLFRELLDDQTRVDLPVAKLLSAIVNDFFAQATPADDFAIRKMLRVLHYRWLDLDFSVVAQAAKIVSPLDSLYFIETWRAHTMPKTESVSTGTWRLLMECYSRLGEADGFNGVASLYREGIDEVLVQKYEHDREWSKIIATQDARLQRVARSGLSAASEPHSAATAHGEQIHLLKALSRSGQHHIIEMYLNGVSYSAEKSARNSDESQPDDSGSFLTQDLAEFHFESLWRMGRWDKTNTQGKSKHTSGTNQRFFECLRSLHEAPCARATAALIQGSLVEFTNEDCRFPESLCVIEASETQTILNDGHAGFNKLLDRWSSRLSQLSELRPFDELEKVLAFRTQLLSSHIKLHWLQGDQGIAIGLLKDLISSNMTFFKEPRVESRALHADLLCLLGKWSSKTQTLNPQLIVREYLLPAVKLREAINEIHRQQRLEAPGTDSKEYYRLAQYCDEILEEMSADETQKHAAQLVLEREQELEQLKILERSAGKGQAGAAAAGPAANAAAIERFKRKLVKQLELDRAEVSRWRHEMSVYLKLSVRNYMMALIHASKHSEETVFRFCSLWFSYSQSESLQETVAQLIDSVPTRKFLILMYQISARFSSSSSAPSTPASALSQAASPATQRMHDDSNAPGRRSGQHKVEANFDKLLEHLILRIVCDYPHHSLPHLVALKNGGASSSRSAGRTSSSKTTAEAAPNMAKMILNKLAAVPIGQGTSHGVSVHSIATNLDYLFHLYIQVANFKHDKTISRDRNAKTFAFDSRMMIAQFEANSQIPVLTHEQPVGGARDYSGIVYITGFEPTYSLPGGINVPKVVQCTGSDGKRYRQLVKGHDDLRQDAVLSSVFNMVNILLLKNFETRKRKLHIRTYKIIPLSPQAGVVQWVDGTVPIGSLLLDAHTRYREGDLSLLECRSLMMAEHERPTSDPASKLAVYRTIEQRFRPAFSLAFLEMFPDPRTWFENRTRFTQSLAASSMAGYIVGLGDRHAQNILFDRQSAELIHIDLGIAFDQGKLLSVPELVPFRLTRDLEDCIGITGVEGQFRRGCEETMRVLRNESHAISMLLDVFRHDPLYNWRISPLKMRKLQHKQAHPVGASGETEQATAQPGRAPRGSRGRSSAATAVHDATSGAVADLEEAIGAAAGAGVGAAPDTRGNEEAERALFGVRKKLSSTLSVECQVSQLISAASDPGNLSRLFPGWQPWL